MEKQPDIKVPSSMRRPSVPAGTLLTNLLLLGLVLAVMADVYVRLSPDRATVQSSEMAPSYGIPKNQDSPPPFQSQATGSDAAMSVADQQRANQDPSARRKKLIDDRIAPSP